MKVFMHVESPRPQHGRTNRPRLVRPDQREDGVEDPDSTTHDAKLVLRFSRTHKLPSLSAKLDAVLVKNVASKDKFPHSDDDQPHASSEADRKDDSDSDDDFADLFVPEIGNALASKITSPIKNDGKTSSYNSRPAQSRSQRTHETKIRRKKRPLSNKGYRAPTGYSGIVLDHTDEQLKKDLNRGSRVVVASGGGLRKPLNKYGNEVKKRNLRILEIRGRVLGGIVAEQRDMARFLALRDVQMWVIVKRWTRQLMRANLRAWHGMVVQAKEDAERFRKLFVKSDRQRLKKCFKILRHAADMGMAQRANAELNNQSADADKQIQKIRELEGRAKESRHKISSLEFQLDSMMQERDEVKDEVKRLKQMLAKQQAREIELGKMHKEQLEAALCGKGETSDTNGAGKEATD